MTPLLFPVVPVGVVHDDRVLEVAPLHLELFRRVHHLRVVAKLAFAELVALGCLADDDRLQCRDLVPDRVDAQSLHVRGGDDHLGAAVIHAVADSLRAEPAEQRGKDPADLGDGHCTDIQFGDSREVHEDAVSLLSPGFAKHVGELVRQQLELRESVLRVLLVGALPVQRDLVLAP